MFYNPEGYFLLKDSYNPHSLYFNPNDPKYIYISVIYWNSWVQTSRSRLLDGYARYFKNNITEEDRKSKLVQTMYKTYQQMLSNSSYLYYKV